MICKNCGRQVPEGASFCEFCNSLVAESVQEVITDTTSEVVTNAEVIAPYDLSEVKTKPKRKPLKVVLAVFAAILGIAIVAYGSVIAYSRYQDSTSSSKHHSKKHDDDGVGLALNIIKPTETAETTDTVETTAIETTPVETTEVVTTTETEPTVTEVVNTTEVLPEGASSWTVLVYMDGSNLESGSGIGSYVISRMDDMVSSDNVNVIVQTGGTSKWFNDEDDYFANDAVSKVDIPSDALGRYQIKNSEVIDLGSVPLDSMGKASTLSDFISWGKANYPAQKYMLVLWNHGYVEPYGNLESDDIFYMDEAGNVYYYEDVPRDAYVTNDCITLDELSKALNDGGVHFEVVTFNTCLSSSMEIASAVAPYANYMVASQESIPAMIGIPEEYISYLNQNPNCTGEDVGTFICQIYSQALDTVINQTNYDEQNGGMFSNSTMALINLNSFGEMQTCFNDVMKYLYFSTYDLEAYSGFINAASKCENYGSDGNVEGNLIDLKSFLLKSAPYLTETDSDEKLIKLIEENILAMNGPSRVNSYGISFFFPSYNYITNLKASVEGELVAGNYSYTEDQLNLIVEQFAARSFEGYVDNIDLNDEYFWYAGYLGYRFNDYWTPADDVYNLINNYDDSHSGDVVVDSKDFEVKYETKLDEEGRLHLSITEGAEAVVSVEMNLVLQLDPDADDDTPVYEAFYTYFGATERGVDSDYNSGEFYNTFACEWYYFGQYPVPVYRVESSDNQTIYGFRAQINGEDVIICFVHDKVTDRCKILYACRIDETDGVASNDIFHIKEGDIIDVYFFSYSSGDPSIYALGEYLYIRKFYTVEYSDDFDIRIQKTYGASTNAKYLMNYTITDAFGNVYYTDFVQYNIVMGAITGAEIAKDVPEEVCNELFELV